MKLQRAVAPVFDKSNERLREEQWVAGCALSPGLLRHLASTRHEYDGYLSFTYLYAPTVQPAPGGGPGVDCPHHA